MSHEPAKLLERTLRKYVLKGVQTRQSPPMEHFACVQSALGMASCVQGLVGLLVDVFGLIGYLIGFSFNLHYTWIAW